jgi:two-component system, NarL family, response regulator DesR
LRILIADDSAMVRRGVIGLLSSEASWEICGEASDGSEALAKARALLPDVILLDVSMPGLNGLEVARQLRREVPRARIIVMSQHDPAHLLPGVMAAGGDACLDKSRLAADLIDSIKNPHPRDQQSAASK